MTLTKQDVIDTILSFDYKKLASWMEARLNGDDAYFPIHEGYETNLSEFLTESFENIKNDRFRENFLEILHDLTTELWGYKVPQVKEHAKYIYELLSLCGTLKKFEKKSILYRIARSGKLKGVKVYNVELHQLLLTALASYRVVGDHGFWIEQMKDDSNKYYANAAFYALLNRKYELGLLFEHIDIFIQRFKGDIDLILGFKALLNDYEPEEIVRRFTGIEDRLTTEQKEAVNHAFKKLLYAGPFKLNTGKINEAVEPADKKKVTYMPLRPTVSMVGEKPLTFGTAGSPEKLTELVGTIFRLMEFT
ncbi:MAG: hypothetical protein GY757_56810, partial [bacterium]|nr:hypothetical protein [bacterium]